MTGVWAPRGWLRGPGLNVFLLLPASRERKKKNQLTATLAGRPFAKFHEAKSPCSLSRELVYVGVRRGTHVRFFLVGNETRAIRQRRQGYVSSSWLEGEALHSSVKEEEPKQRIVVWLSCEQDRFEAEPK